MLHAGSSKTVNFNVNIMGTSATPQSVKVVLGTTPELSFVARQVGEGWQADLEVPIGAPDSVDLRVEVVINNRLFTPIHKRIPIIQAVKDEPLVSQEPAGTDHTVVPDQDEIEDLEVWEKKVEQAKPITAPISQKPSILKQFEEAESKKKTVVSDVDAALTKLEAITKQPAKKIQPKLTSGMKSRSKVTEKIVVKIADINAIASKNFDQALSETKTRVAPAKRVIKEASVPVKLVKGEIVYE